jgi:hypothetical protein
VRRTGNTSSPLSVKYLVGGTATNGVDYHELSGVVVIPASTWSAFIPVVPIDDAEREGTETVILTLSADPKYTVGSPASATVNIRDNEAVVSITAFAPNASEMGQKGYFRVRRTGNTSSPLSVKYLVGGTATNGVDYHELSGAVTIRAGVTFADIAVTPIDDAVHEGTETVIATVSADPNYKVGNPNSATVKIKDNDWRYQEDRGWRRVPTLLLQSKMRKANAAHTACRVWAAESRRSKMKKALLVLAIACVISTSFALNADAGAWYTCTINQIGSQSSYVFVMLTDTNGAFSTTTFLMDTSNPNVDRMLQLAIYAAGKHRKISVYLETTTAGSILGGLIAIQ